MNLWSYLETGGKRAYEVAHRRWGKDDVCLNWSATAALQKPATYWHMLPEASQARKAIWDAINPHTGVRRIDEAFPKALRQTTREQDMLIRFVNGSTWQVVGSDNYDSLVGSPPAGVVFSEWALAKPDAWAYLKPILDENDGWALFITTPRGKNHAHRMFEAAQGSSNWFAELQTIHDSGLMDCERIEQIKQEYIAEFGPTHGLSRFEQEYLCSWEAAVYGAVYGDQMRSAYADGRICDLPIETSAPVNTFWDLGSGYGITTCWFHQRVGQKNHFIDYAEYTATSVDLIARDLKDRGYHYGVHYLPHDGETKDRTMTSMRQYLEGFNLKPVEIVARIPELNTGIEMTRQFFASCLFDRVRCKEGLAALQAYHYREDETHQTLAKPVHDWSSHAADAFRQAAQGYRPNTGWNDEFSPWMSDRRKGLVGAINTDNKWIV